jgi:hypothetical protein
LHLKPTLIEIYEFNAFTNLMSLVLNTEQEEDFNVNPRDISKGLIKGQSVVCYEHASAYQINVKNNCHDTKKRENSLLTDKARNLFRCNYNFNCL